MPQLRRVVHFASALGRTHSSMLTLVYDPTTGQFMSVDPDLAETDQPYAYAGDDSVNEADPTGLEAVLHNHDKRQKVNDGP